MAAHHEAVGGQLFPHQAAALEAHGLAFVLLGLVGHIPVEEGEVLVPYLHYRGVYIKGQGVFNVIIYHLAVLGLVGDIRPAGGPPDDLVEGHLVHGLLVKAVEDHQLCAFQLVVDQLAHVAVVAEEGGRVGEHELLIYHPALGHGVVEHIQHPHAVVLHHHPLGPGLGQPFLQVLPGQAVLVLHHPYLHGVGGKLLRGVFLFPLFADQQQGLLPIAEAPVLQSLLDELGLAPLQEAGEEVYRDVFSVTQY